MEETPARFLTFLFVPVPEEHQSHVLSGGKLSDIPSA